MDGARPFRSAGQGTSSPISQPHSVATPSWVHIPPEAGFARAPNQKYLLTGTRLEGVIRVGPATVRRFRPPRRDCRAGRHLADRTLEPVFLSLVLLAPPAAAGRRLPSYASAHPRYCCSTVVRLSSHSLAAGSSIYVAAFREGKSLKILPRRSPFPASSFLVAPSLYA